jgi:hypothetical protein
MLDVRDICSLTEFQRNAREHIRRLRKSGRPAVLTVNGRAELIVQDATAYQRLLELIDRAEAVIGVQRGLTEVSRGRGLPIGQAEAMLRSRHAIPGRTRAKRAG